MLGFALLLETDLVKRRWCCAKWLLSEIECAISTLNCLDRIKDSFLQHAVQHAKVSSSSSFCHNVHKCWEVAAERSLSALM